jgi:hypothetical protein
MAITEEIKKCTSKTFKKGQKDQECGTPLLLIKPMRGGGGPVYICPDCDGLEYLPRATRERIFEQ